jgi:hypothetical protein
MWLRCTISFSSTPQEIPNSQITLPDTEIGDNCRDVVFAVSKVKNSIFAPITPIKSTIVRALTNLF